MVVGRDDGSDARSSTLTTRREGVVGPASHALPAPSFSLSLRLAPSLSLDHDATPCTSCTPQRRRRRKMRRCRKRRGRSGSSKGRTATAPSLTRSPRRRSESWTNSPGFVSGGGVGSSCHHPRFASGTPLDLTRPPPSPDTTDPELAEKEGDDSTHGEKVRVSGDPVSWGGGGVRP